MKPFLFLGIRAENAAADDEYAAVLRCAGLEERDVRRVRLEREELSHLDLEDWSGIVVGGGPWNVSDPADRKTPEQRRGEARLAVLAREVVAADFPFLGACYGVGTLGQLEGGVVDRTWPEPIGPLTVTLTADGEADSLLGVLPSSFQAFVGHKEAVTVLPRGGVLLASSATCPVHAFRLRTRSTPPSSTPSSTSRESSAASASTATTATTSPTRATRSSPRHGPRWSPSRHGCWPGSWSCSPATDAPETTRRPHLLG